jgi:hypothetical protein
MHCRIKCTPRWLIVAKFFYCAANQLLYSWIRRTVRLCMLFANCYIMCVISIFYLHVSPLITILRPRTTLYRYGQTSVFAVIWVPTDQGYYEPDTSALLRLKMASEYGYGINPTLQMTDKLIRSCDTCNRLANPCVGFPEDTRRVILRPWLTGVPKHCL